MKLKRETQSLLQKGTRHPQVRPAIALQAQGLHEQRGAGPEAPKTPGTAPQPPTPSPHPTVPHPPPLAEARRKLTPTRLRGGVSRRGRRS